MTGKMSNPKEPNEAPLVTVIDDDDGVRTSLESLLRSVGFRVEGFGSAQDFLGSPSVETSNCLILDIRLPRMSGLDFQSQLQSVGVSVPIIFMTGHGDIPMSVQAMKAGAVDFLAKPFRDQEMLDAVSVAIERDRERRETDGAIEDDQERYRNLSEREQQVMAFATAGLLNKQIAYELGISEITVKIHRGRVMRKMAASSFADLVRIALRLGVSPEKTGE